MSLNDDTIQRGIVFLKMTSGAIILFSVNSNMTSKLLKCYHPTETCINSRRFTSSSNIQHDLDIAQEIILKS